MCVWVNTEVVDRAKMFNLQRVMKAKIEDATGASIVEISGARRIDPIFADEQAFTMTVTSSISDGRDFSP